MQLRSLLGVAVLASLGLAQHAVAQTASCGEEFTTIYYANGVNNSPIMASLMKNHLRVAYESSLSAGFPGQGFVFLTAYNETAGLRNDLIETFRQKLEESGEIEVGPAAAVASLQLVNIFANVGRAAADRLLGALSLTPPLIEGLADTYSEVVAARVRLDINATAFRDRWANELEAFQRVLIVAHSQGNLFANGSAGAAQSLVPSREDGIGVVGVATPADSTLPGAAYFTAEDDRVINALRLLADVLPGNVDNDPGVFFDDRDLLNHAFWESYFSPELLSRGLIDGEVGSLADALEFFPAIGSYDGTFDVIVDGEPASGTAGLTLTGSTEALSGSFSLQGVTSGTFSASGRSFSTSWSGSFGGDPVTGTISCEVFLDDSEGVCAPTIECIGNGFTSEGSGSGSLHAVQL